MEQIIDWELGAWGPVFHLLRVAANESQDEHAQGIGISRAHLSNIERRKIAPRWPVILAVLKRHGFIVRVFHESQRHATEDHFPVVNLWLRSMEHRDSLESVRAGCFWCNKLA